MRFILALTTLLTVAVLLAAADRVSGVTYVAHEKVTAALSKGGPLVSAPDLLVSGSHRDKAGQVELHEKETDVIYVVDGTATFVTGAHVTISCGERMSSLAFTDPLTGLANRTSLGASLEQAVNRVRRRASKLATPSRRRTSSSASTTRVPSDTRVES